MLARRPIRILSCALGLTALSSAALLVATSSQGQPPGPAVPEEKLGQKGAEGAATKSVSDAGNASERDEWSILAREEVASLDAYLKAKKYQLREAEYRLQVARANLSNVDRQLKKGVTSAYNRMLGELSVVEAEADRETRAAELEDMKILRDRATRRIALIDRGGIPVQAGLDALSSAERLAILERKTDRLRYEMDRTD